MSNKNRRHSIFLVLSDRAPPLNRSDSETLPMASGAILPSEREPPKKRLAKFIPFDVPFVRANGYRGHEVDLLLLAWYLLLYRYSNGNHIPFTWGTNGPAADFTFDFTTSTMTWNASDSIAKALEGVESYRQLKEVRSLIALDNAIVFFNDKCAPSDLHSNARVSDGDALGGGMTWVRAAPDGKTSLDS